MECKLVIQRDNLPFAVTFHSENENLVKFFLNNHEFKLSLDQLYQLANFFNKKHDLANFKGN